MNVSPKRSGFSLRDVGVLLGTVAVLLRCLIAPGFMPDFTAAADGEFKLVICGSGPLKTFAPQTGENGQRPNHQQAPDLCPFSVLGHLATLTDLVLLQSEPVRPAIEPTPYNDAVVVPAVRTFSARAPPYVS